MVSTDPDSLVGCDHTDSAPYLSPDGEALLFTSDRPNPAHGVDPERRPRRDLWISKRAEGVDWGTPDAFPHPSGPADGGYEVSNLGPSINTEASEADIYVDPDERFILFATASIDGGFGADDIYLSRNMNGEWSQPVSTRPARPTVEMSRVGWTRCCSI